MIRDPDRRDVVFAPWVYGEVPDPVDRAERGHPALTHASELTLDIGWYYGDRSRLRALFEEADDSSEPLDTYIDEGRVIVARLGDQVVGHLQLIDAGRDGSVELSNLAVVPQKRGVGIGRRRVDQAIVVSLQDGYARMIAAPAAADIENLRFYQRLRVSAVQCQTGRLRRRRRIPAGLTIDGIPLRHRVWFDQRL